ncbi:methyl-accepting chemotaxis protein [Delftia sp. PS-11]|uniref:methyl-accepting chemotaxis protein n=1 Tax=Delftia sp. PS-11 TaxID=2767222 RepID=UPI003AB49DCD
MSNQLSADVTALHAPRSIHWNVLSLRTRFFAAAAIALGATVLLVILLQSALASRQQLQRLRDYELPAQLQSVASRIQAQLNTAISGSEALANNTFIQSWIAAGSPAEQLPLIEAAMARTQRSLHAKAVFLATALPGGAHYYHYENGRLQDRAMASGDPESSWYFNFVRQQNAYELNLDSDPLSNHALMFINYRGEPMSADGRFPAAVAGGGMDMEQLAELIRANKVGGSGSVMLVRADGVVDMHPDPALAGKLDLHSQPGFSALLDNGWKRVRDQGIAVVDSEFQGEPAYVAATYLPDLQRYLIAQLPAAELARSVAYTRWVTLAAGAALLLLGMAVLYPLSGQLLRPLQTLQQQIASITESLDLGTRLHSNDRAEIGRICAQLNRFLERLRTAFSGVHQTIDGIHSRAAAIAVGNRELSARTESQAAALEESASSLQQLTQSVQYNADSARQASALSGDASGVALRGGELMTQVVSQMRSIAQSSERIADIVAVIDSIAFQTNILALNAAVEAARAGEQGRGFAVVAGEVRALAQRSASAAQEIRQLIGESSERVRTGAGQVEQAGETMAQIVTASGRVSELIQTIATASEQQARGLASISQASAQMEGGTQQNAAMVEEVAAAATHLEQEAARLRTLMGAFHFGSAATPLRMPAPDGVGLPQLASA